MYSSEMVCELLITINIFQKICLFGNGKRHHAIHLYIKDVLIIRITVRPQKKEQKTNFM